MVKREILLKNSTGNKETNLKLIVEIPKELSRRCFEGGEVVKSGQAEVVVVAVVGLRLRYEAQSRRS